MKKLLLSLAGLVSVFIFSFSCKNIGLGAEVDLEAPVVTVTTPESLSKVHRHFELCGTCTDNIKVTAVTVSNFVTGKVYGDATITGTDWMFPMALDPEEEGELSLLVTASDPSQNQSTKSKKVITYLVDDTAPISEEWYIERGAGITINLFSKEYLQAVDTTVSVNKDIPQNQSFIIHGKVSDSMSINKVTVSLYDGNTEVISKTVTGSYTPAATFTHDEIIAKNSAYATGKHYFQIHYKAEDDHGNPSSDDVGFVLWWPESDNPGIVQTDADNQQKLGIEINNSIPVDMFDDDEIKEYYIALKNDTSAQLTGVTEAILVTDETKRNAIFSEDNRVKTTTDTAKLEYIKTDKSITDGGTISAGSRDISHIIPTTATAAASPMKLVVCVKDVNGKWSAKIYSVSITDGEIPLLYVTSPEENAIPAVETGTTKFKLKGYALDKRDANKEGTVKIAYIPDSVGNSDAKEARAKEIFADNTITWSTPGTKTNFTDGVKLIWKKTTRDNTFTDPTGNNWKKRTYEFEYDLNSYFGTGGGTITKFFGIMYTDINGNEIFKKFIISGDNVPPTIVNNSSAANMAVVNPNTQSLTLSFKGTKTSGLPMNDDTYKISINGTSTEYTKASGLTADSTNGGYKVTLGSTALKALNLEQPTFVFEVEDKFGNKATDRRTIVLTDLPAVTSITTDKPTGTYKTGDVLTFQVNFSKEVKVTGTPKLNLYYSTSDTEAKKATYSSGNRTKSLTFTWTVPENVTSDKIIIKTSDYLTLDTGVKIEPDGLGEGNAQCETLTSTLDGVELKIDSVSPKFSTIKYTTTVDDQSGVKYIKKDDVITAELTATENILVSGAPKLILKSGTESLSFDFQGVNGKEATFVHKVTTSSPNGSVGLNGTAYLSTADAKTITDEIGNELTMQALTASSCDSITIDTVAPSVPTIKLNNGTLTAGTKTTAQTLTLTNVESGATAYYSLNAGSSWNVYTTGVSLPDGESEITAKQKDKAGNESTPPDAVKVNVQTTFPSVTALTITNTNGWYKYEAGKNNAITMNVTFAEKVKLPTANAKLTFTDYDDKGSYEATFAAATTATNTLTATYIIKNTDVIKGIKVTGFTAGSIEDANGNKPGTTVPLTGFLTEGNGWRKEVKVDGVAPKIATSGGYTPAKDGVLTHAYTVNDSGVVTDRVEVTLKFNEKVYVEKGYVTLQRIGADNTTNKDNWAIPAVLSNEKFMNIYNQLSSTTDRETLMVTIAGNGSGAEKLQDTTARPVGPYMKYTHGINADGSPDQTTKFVLAPEYDIFGTTGTVKNIRDVLIKTGYHQHKVDINSTQVTGNGTDTITIKFNDEIAEGQHWALLMDSTCLRDEAGNTFEGFSDVTKYNFWSKTVAQPVVRVFRYSHNIGAQEPTNTTTNGYVLVEASDVKTRNITKWTNNGTTYNNANADSATKLAPTGNAQVRIDCETPGASIKFSVTNSGSATQTNATTVHTEAGNKDGESKYDNKGKYSTTANKATSAMTSATVAYTKGQRIIVGDNSYTTARKDYVTARATAPTAASTMAQSPFGYEGIFKTVVHYNGKANSQIQIQGGTFNGGMPSLPGFPLRDAVQGTDSQRYNQNCYQPANDTDEHYWVTYDIISEFSILSVSGSSGWSQLYSYGDYGQYMYLSNISHY